MQDENPKPSKLKAVFAVVLVVLLIAGVVLTAVYLASQSDDGHTKTAEEFLVTLYTVEEPPAPASQEMVAELAETYSRYLTEDAVTTLLANRTPVRIAQSAADAGVTLECGRVDIQKDDSGDDLLSLIHI